MMDDTGNISVYKGMDPDDLYYKFPDHVITFYFIPKSGNLHTVAYPENHQDMLLADDDLIREVFPKRLLQIQQHRNVGEDGAIRLMKRDDVGRGQALSWGEALLGRIALDNMTPLIAFWKGDNVPLDTATIGAFLNALYRKMPHFKKFQDTTVLLLPGQPPVTVATYTGAKPAATSPEREIAQRQARKRAAKPKVKETTFMIDGQNYTLSDLQAMRAAVHKSGVTHPALCHPDLAHYPELAGYRPNTCGKAGGTLRPTHPQNWRQAGREAGFPYLYTPEHQANFKSWLSLREALHIS